MDTAIKKNWFIKFIQFTPTPNHRLLLVDGHSSNFDLDIYNLANENNITIMQFPSNSTHLVQPLDMLFFRILKDGIRKKLCECRKKKESIVKENIPKLLEDPWRIATCRGTITKSFELAGIYPLDNKYSHLKLTKTDHLKEILFPEKSSNGTLPEKIPNGVVFQTNISLSNSSDVSNLIQNSNPMSLSKTEIISLLNDELKDFISEQIYEAIENKKKNKKTLISTKTGKIISSPEMKSSLEQKKKKRIEKDVKKLEEDLKRKKLEYSLLNSNSNALALPAPSNLMIINPQAVCNDSIEPPTKKRKIDQFFTSI